MNQPDLQGGFTMPDHVAAALGEWFTRCRDWEKNRVGVDPRVLRTEAITLPFPRITEVTDEEDSVVHG